MSEYDVQEKIPATETTPRAIQHVAFGYLVSLCAAANGIEYEL